MELLPYSMTSLEEKTFSAVNADIFTEADIMPIDFTALFTFVDP